MGKIFSAVFGGKGSKAKSQEQSQSTSVSNSGSFNNAYPELEKAYMPAVTTGTHALDFIASLLGQNGDPAASDAFNKYKDSAGYNFVMDSGRKAIDNSAASKGTLNSGATLKALSDYGQNTGTSFFNNYLDKLFNLGTSGLQAGSLVGQAGQQSFGSTNAQSTSSGSSKSYSWDKPGLGGFIGNIVKTVAGGGG
jgi:hypothetical protein